LIFAKYAGLFRTLLANAKIVGDWREDRRTSVRIHRRRVSALRAGRFARRWFSRCFSIFAVMF
jgi:hypothetical protein